MSDFKKVLKYAAAVFKTEKVTKLKNGEKEIIWSLESDVNREYSKYMQSGSEDSRMGLANKIFSTYAALWQEVNKKGISIYDENNYDNENLSENISTLTLAVSEMVVGKHRKEFDAMLDRYDYEKNDSFLMYFHYCVSQKFMAKRSEELKSDLYSGDYNKSGARKLKKINEESGIFYGHDANSCTDEQLFEVCTSLNEKGIFNNLTVKKARKIIGENTINRLSPHTDYDNSSAANSDVDSAVYNDTRLSGGSDSWSRVSDYWREDDEMSEGMGEAEGYRELMSESSPESDYLEAVENSLDKIKVTERDRYYFTLKIMYNFMYESCSKQLNSIRAVYCEFVRVAGWLSDNEKKSARRIYEYILDYSIKNRKFPTIGVVATEVLGLSGSSQISHAYKAVSRELESIHI